MNKELKDKLLYMIKKKKTIDEICDSFGIDIDLLKEYINILNSDDNNFEIVNNIITKKCDRKYELPIVTNNLKLCLISDTHLCSKYERLDILRHIYDEAKEKEIEYILHSGDFTDGFLDREFHKNYLKQISFEEQVNYCIENYPFIEGIKTFVIQGNHDDWWLKNSKKEIVKEIAKEREDIIYLGRRNADLTIGKTKIKMVHANNDYSSNRFIEKYIENNPDNIPDIIQIGHYHKNSYNMVGYTHCFQTGSLQDITPYNQINSYPNDKACWWIDAITDQNGGIIKLNMELESFENNNSRIRRKK